MRTFIKNPLILLSTLLVGTAACKKNVSAEQKSMVALEAAERFTPEDKSAAPVLVALTLWFDGFEVKNSHSLDHARKKAVSSSVWSKYPDDLRLAFAKYLRVQIARIDEFLAALGTDGFKAEPQQKVLEELLEKESHEIYDIAMVLLDRNHTLRTSDPLAVLLKETSMDRFPDRFAEEYLAEQIVARRKLQPKANIIKDLIENLETERVNYLAAMKRIYLSSPKALETFGNDLRANRRAAEVLRDYLEGKSAMFLAGPTELDHPSSVAGMPAVFLQYGDGLFDQLQGGGNALGGQPVGELSAFQGLPDEEAGMAPGMMPGQPMAPRQVGMAQIVAPVAPVAPNASAKQISQLVKAVGKAAGRPAALALTWQNPNTSYYSAQPTLDCGSYQLDPAGEILCARYGANLNLSLKDMRRTGVAPAAAFPLAAVGGSQYSSALVRKYSTAVQDQGPDGACTAFGLTHTLESTLKMRKSFSAQNFWQAYNEPYVDKALSTARSYNWVSTDGQTRAAYGGESELTSLEQIKGALDQKVAVYMASGVNDSWFRGGGGGSQVTCGGDGGSGHAYSIVGYRQDGAQCILVVKNSWGSEWKEKGYGYMPCECWGQGNASAYVLNVRGG